MRAMTLAIAAAFAFGAGAVTTAPAFADGIEQPRPAPRARPAPRPQPQSAPPPRVIEESAPVPVIQQRVEEDRGVRLTDAFFMGPLTGGVGVNINSDAVGGGSAIAIAGGGHARFSGAAHRGVRRIVGHGRGGACN